jgi:hypothetical protein
LKFIRLTEDRLEQRDLTHLMRTILHDEWRSQRSAVVRAFRSFAIVSLASIRFASLRCSADGGRHEVTAARAGGSGADGMREWEFDSTADDRRFDVTQLGSITVERGAARGRVARLLTDTADHTQPRRVDVR